jgi:hypothetical protein
MLTAIFFTAMLIVIVFGVIATAVIHQDEVSPIGCGATENFLFGTMLAGIGGFFLSVGALIGMALVAIG